jgi:glyoxylase-like metal-dependent hydrolase (beta-lactamase superfamily II)
MAGEAWLPVDNVANTIYRIQPNSAAAQALVLPDAVADCATTTAHGRMLVSCWDGWLYLLASDGRLEAKQNIGNPARIIWSNDGTFAIVGTTDGRLIRINQNGELVWTRPIPETEIAPLPKPPAEVVPGLPVFQGGRIPGGEHAYVGDIWMIKTGAEAVFVDAGGTSGFSHTQARLRALDIGQVTHVLQTHTHGDHCGGAYLWRVAGAKIVAPKSASFSQTWLMPMLTDYGIYPPRPVDIPLPLTRAGDEADFEVSGLKFHALFVPGHSFDLTIYTAVLGGRRVAFTGDLGFENQDILHRCWGDVEKARDVARVVRSKLLAWRPEVVFTGHGVRTNGLEFLTSLVEKTEASLQEPGSTR